MGPIQWACSARSWSGGRESGRPNKLSRTRHPIEPLNITSGDFRRPSKNQSIRKLLNFISMHPNLSMQPHVFKS